MRARERDSFKRINARRIKRFLYDMVNLPDDHQRMLTFIKVFKEFFPEPFPANCWLAEEASRFELKYGSGPPMSEAIRSEYCFDQLKRCRNHLRFVWAERNREVREWRMQELRKAARLLTIHPSVVGTILQRMLGDDPPPEDAFQQALIYFKNRAQIARRCIDPDCRHTPFFFANYPNQKYCTEECSHESRKAAKLNWWHNRPIQARQCSPQPKKRK